MTPRPVDWPERKQVLLRLDLSVRMTLTRWVADDLRPVNAQIEYLFRDTLKRTGHLPGDIAPIRRPGRLPRSESG